MSTKRSKTTKVVKVEDTSSDSDLIEECSQDVTLSKFLKVHFSRGEKSKVMGLSFSLKDLGKPFDQYKMYKVAQAELLLLQKKQDIISAPLCRIYLWSGLF